jgi:hypothetical protein
MNTDAVDTPRRPSAGVGITIWTGGDLAAALPPAMRSLLAEARPQIVALHAGPKRLGRAAEQLARDVRALVSGVRLHVGVGCDVWMADAIARRVTEAAAVTALSDAADLADALGAEAVVLDAEAACKADSSATWRMARALVARVRARHPALIQGHTAYDHPTLHSDDVDGEYDDGHVRGEYAWRAWLSPGGVDWELPQNYVAPEQVEGAAPAFAPRGALERRCVSSDRSFARAEQLGWIRPGLPRDRYLQAHHVPFAQTATVGARARVVQLWCGPRTPLGRMDASGEYALRVLCALERAGARGDIAAWQRAHGLVADGIVGRATAAALGIVVPPDVR